MDTLKLQKWEVTDINGEKYTVQAHYIERWSDLQIVFFHKEECSPPKIVAHFAKWTNYIALDS